MNAAMIWQQRLFAAGAIVCIGTVLLDVSPPVPLQVLLLTLLVVLVGLPHGALDPLVARKAHVWRTPTGLSLFLLAYVVLAAAVLGLWLILPGIALAAFLCYSAWHFSADWKATLPPPLAMAAGLLVIAGPALFHQSETAAIFALLSSDAAAASLTTILLWIAVPSLVGAALAVLTTARHDLPTALEIGLLGLAVAVLPPLLFFLVYFCGLHSPRHLLHAVDGLPRGRAFGVAALFTILSVAAGAGALAILPRASLPAGALQILFIGLAALTVPHMILVELAEDEPRNERRPPPAGCCQG